jgi:hypothetical protein
MKYSVRYNRSLDLKSFDEIIIELKDEKYEDLLGFFNRYSDKRIVIKIDDCSNFLEENKIELFKQLEEENPEFNYTFLLKKYDLDKKTEVIQLLYDNDFSYYVEDFISDEEEMWNAIRTGYSDVIITDSLCFYLEDIAPILHSYGINVRVFPNICQRKFLHGNDIKSFFIRAEDVKIYEPYVDIFEFWGEDNQQEAYKNIYSKSKQWVGPLNQYIIGFKEEVEGHHILPTFGERRLGCGRSCLRGGRCRLCDAYIQLSSTLKKNDLVLVNEEMDAIKSKSEFINID